MWGSFGTLTKQQTMRSYELLGREVIPALAAFQSRSRSGSVRLTDCRGRLAGAEQFFAPAIIGVHKE